GRGLCPGRPWGLCLPRLPGLPARRPPRAGNGVARHHFPSPVNGGRGGGPGGNMRSAPYPPARTRPRVESTQRSGKDAFLTRPSPGIRKRHASPVFSKDVITQVIYLSRYYDKADGMPGLIGRQFVQYLVITRNTGIATRICAKEWSPSA